jgi:radical SAM superfamily enzyme YgiQ (UPF0313 family)
MRSGANATSVFLLMAPCRRLQFNLSDLYPVPRLGIAVLASYLRAHSNAHVEVRDIIAEREWIPELLDRFARNGAPDLLGISVTILSLREAFEIARAVKGRFPGTRVVVGGPGVGFRAEALLEYGEAVDYFVRGEGEQSMLALLDAVTSGATDLSLSDVPRLIWRDETGAARENATGPYRDLNDGIEVSYEDLPMESYRLHPPMGIHPPATMIETARGCTFPCDFCCLSMPLRTRTPEGVEREIVHLKRQYGIREVHFVDPTFTINRERTRELLGRLRTLDIRWSCKTRVDRLDEPLAAEMSKAGCYLVAFGVESGDDTILGNLQKKAASEQAIETVAACRRHKIRSTAYLLVASPGETDDTVDRNIAFVRRLKPDYVLYDVLMADPANPLTRRATEVGTLTREDMERYYLSDLPSSLHQTSVSGHDMVTVRAWIKKASTDFYVRPRYFWERVRDLRSLQDARNLGSGGFAFMRDVFGLGQLWGMQS